MTEKAKRFVILEAIEAGGATKESLIELVGTTNKGLSSQFTYLRMGGKCPMKNDDGTYRIGTTEEWEAHKAEVREAAKAKRISPEKRLEKANKRLDRAKTSLTNAEKRVEANENDRLDELYDLKQEKAEIELKIAQLEVDLASEDMPDSDD